jgi:DtxR family transcriptional regulator, manganese transport regulator
LTPGADLLRPEPGRPGASGGSRRQTPLDGGTDAPAGTTARRAAAFRKTREAHLTEIAEDYVELIGDLTDEFGEARLTDIADSMAVTQATASKIVSRLKREGLVENRPYRSIFLTEAGRIMAAEARRRHGIVRAFLRALGIDEATAEADSEGIEHHVSAVTLDALAALTERLRRNAPPHP